MCRAAILRTDLQYEEARLSFQSFEWSPDSSLTLVLFEDERSNLARAGCRLLRRSGRASTADGRDNANCQSQVDNSHRCLPRRSGIWVVPIFLCSLASTPMAGCGRIICTTKHAHDRHKREIVRRQPSSVAQAANVRFETTDSEHPPAADGRVLPDDDSIAAIDSCRP